MKLRKNSRWSLYSIILCIILSLYVLSLITPMIWALFTSVKSRTDFVVHTFQIPEKFVWENYLTAFKNLYIPMVDDRGMYFVYFEEMLWNSLIYSIGSAFVSTMIPCIVAYVTQKYRFQFSEVVYTIVIVTMILPIVGSLPSAYQLAKKLALLNSFWGMFLMKANFLGTYYLVFFAVFKGVSWEYAEAAIVDGASHFKIMLRIMIPLVKTTILTVFLLNFIAIWNDYQTPMIYMPLKPVAAYGIFWYSFSSTGAINSEPIRLAGCMILTIPIFILFFLFQDKIMGNLTMGGIKG